ncbi:putative lysozyme inhibitor [Serratia phage Moabite]|uniref:Putative lysozyme inhibitor n=1 Tax=Serratia phage Moabite TaxID=2587814 RepID=A0A4Y5TPK2_9CAUD|nr:putative lysozyme inhibitor [Serratia phage Moabite]QDB71298.1 putative lysozyme inhibitor [Serratia phage Moabite]UCR74790.1 putative lysozyme inhibitor [Serratia phage BUCT660]UGO54151.1 hypothetical protein HAYMO_169 [Serratia phage vB_SmaM_Haymo]
MKTIITVLTTVLIATVPFLPKAEASNVYHTDKGVTFTIDGKLAEIEQNGKVTKCALVISKDATSAWKCSNGKQLWIRNKPESELITFAIFDLKDDYPDFIDSVLKK